MNAKILIVEDDIYLREGLEELLTKENYEPVCAKNCAEAKALFKKDTFDLIILDVMLPDGNGLDLCGASALLVALTDNFGLAVNAESKLSVASKRLGAGGAQLGKGAVAADGIEHFGRQSLGKLNQFCIGNGVSHNFLFLS